MQPSVSSKGVDLLRASITWTVQQYIGHLHGFDTSETQPADYIWNLKISSLDKSPTIFFLGTSMA